MLTSVQIDSMCGGKSDIVFVILSTVGEPQKLYVGFH